MTVTDQTITEPIKVAPAPWQLKGSGWVFVTHSPFSEEPVALPAGSYAPFEAGSSFDRSDAFHGGAGSVMIVRYSESPVGPYDELLIAPGSFSTVDSDGKTSYDLAITRIYVSSKESVKNGRANWGIPKHLAVFEFEPVKDKPSSTLLTVAHPSSPQTPFFRAILRTSKLSLVSLPVSTSWITPTLSRYFLKSFLPQLRQPALPPVQEVSASRATDDEPATLTGTNAALLVKPKATGWAKIARIEKYKSLDSELGGGFGDGVSFPSFAAVGGAGVHLSAFAMVFPEPEVC